MSVNPWNSDPEFFDGFSKIISVNERFTTFNSTSHMDSPEHQPSVEFIQILKELTKKNKDLTHINFQIQRRKLYKEFYCVLSCDILDGLLSMVEFLSLHFQMIIDNKVKLVNKFRKLQSGDYVVVDASCHSDMCEFFPGIAHSVNDLQTILHNIEWFNSNFFESVEFRDSLDLVASALSVLQNHHQVIIESRDAMKTLVKNK